MILYVLRGLFILLVASVATLYLLPFQKIGDLSVAQIAMMMGATLGVSGLVILADVLTRRKKLSAVSGVFLGLIVGLLVTFALSKFVDLIKLFMPPPNGVTTEAFNNLLEGVKVFIGLITCYLGISLILQTKGDFRFVIPYVEFVKEIRGNQPAVLDTSVIIDGRIYDIVQTRTVQGSLIVPKFVLNELQAIADSSDKLRRARGRRGLDVLQKLQETSLVDVTIDETEAEGATVDQKLVALAQQTQARIMTSDYNLTKIARLGSVDVININDLAKAVRPVVLPGETMNVKIIKPGEAAGQGVGYLEDGTMVVVENGRKMLGHSVNLVVTSSLQTSAGRMIFGRCIAMSTHHSEADKPFAVT